MVWVYTLLLQYFFQTPFLIKIPDSFMLRQDSFSIFQPKIFAKSGFFPGVFNFVSVHVQKLFQITEVILNVCNIIVSYNSVKRILILKYCNILCNCIFLSSRF